jgi:hypothetical protein
VRQLPSRVSTRRHPRLLPANINDLTAYNPRIRPPPLHACAIVRALPPTLIALLSASLAAADDLVTQSRIKVQLLAAPAFVSEVSVDAYNAQCLSLDNNLYAASVLGT